MTVDEMLDRTPSYRLTEWAAYEQLYGPLGHTYADNQLAAIEERLAYLTEVTGKRGSKATPKAPEHVKRPWELGDPPKRRRRSRDELEGGGE